MSKTFPRGFWVIPAFLVLVGSGSRADDTPPKPDLSGYKTVNDAATRAITPPRSGQAGRTGYLGVSLVKDAQGKLVVDEIQPDSPAIKAGVARGDVVARLDGETLKSPESFRDALQLRGPGESVTLSLIRGDQKIEAKATLSATSRPRAANAQPAFLGVVLGSPKEGGGVPIDEVAADSPAAAAGFKPGDLIFQIEGVDFTNGSRLTEILLEKKPGDVFEITVRRGTEDIALKAKLGAPVVGGGFRAGGQGGQGGQARPGQPGGGAGGGGGGRGQGQGPGGQTIPLWTKPEFRVAVVLIEFPDVKHHAKTPVADWNQALLAEGGDGKKETPENDFHGSLNDYFLEQSAGAFRLKGKVFDWVEVGKKRNDYVLGSGVTNITAVLVEALEKVVARDGKEAFNDFDGLFFVYAGELVRGNRGGVYFPHSGMIRSFQAKRWPYLFIPEGGERPTAMGGMVKEFAQVLGLPDLAARTENRGSEGLGPWCVLSNPLRGNRPQHLSAWAKEKMGWLKPTVIDPTVPQKLILGPVEGSSKECFKILVRPDGSEYFLLENRRKTGFDQGLPGEGLLIWRVVKDRPILEESHGIEGPSGPTLYLESVPYPSPANHAFTPETTPSSRSPLGGGLPVEITRIQRLDDGRISFQIGYEYR
jgi:M6 family metalloprotease-like protein